jgi:hypothetical protein
LPLSPALSKTVQEDTREECAKFGEVLAVFIPRPHPPRFGNGRLVGVKDSALHVRMARSPQPSFLWPTALIACARNPTLP